MGTKAPVTYTINGVKVEFDGDYYVKLKNNGEFDDALDVALIHAHDKKLDYVIVRE